MLKSKFLIAVFALTALSTRAQVFYKYDNVLYKAVYLNQAFHLMDSMQNFLLLDVRSPGEYADTARATALNIGRFKGAVNVPIDSVQNHLGELKKYMDQPVFVYCSHSQRSRRVSKFLAENGFQHVYNINGGMSIVNESDAAQFPAKKNNLISETLYANIGPADAMTLMENTPDLVIIDIRSPAAFENKDSLKQNNIGHLKNAINIPQEDFDKKLNSFQLASNRPVLLYDAKGYNSMDVVSFLRDRGFTRIYNLYGGLETFIGHHGLNDNRAGLLIVGAPPFQILNPKACIDLLNSQPGLVIVDARPEAEFNNKSDKVYLNLGILKGAVNITNEDALHNLISQKDKSTPILIYASNDQWGFALGYKLVDLGYTKVYYMGQGFYHFVWSTANIENCQQGRSFLVNHEGIY
jgi:rhodanese-related sulfurtransferase